MVSIPAAYTSNGRQRTVADGEGNLSTFVYDGFDRLARVLYPNPAGGGSSTGDDELYQYDPASNPTRIERRNGQVIALGYDRLNRLSLRNPPGTDKDVTYAYDLLGRMTSAAFPSQTLGFAYDQLNRNVSASGPLGTVSYQYDPSSGRVAATSSRKGRRSVFHPTPAAPTRERRYEQTQDIGRPAACSRRRLVHPPARRP